MAWHSDHELLFGEYGDSKLIVSVSFGTATLFKRKAQSCLDSAASFCWLYHGDLLIMDGRVQDEFLHCTDPGLDKERINVTFRVLLTDVCAGVIRSGCRVGWM